MMKNRLSTLKKMWIAVFVTLAIPRESAAAEYVLLSQDTTAVYAKEPDTGRVLFQDPDAMNVIDWAMNTYRITVIGEGNYAVKEPIAIPRPGISLVIAEGATVELDIRGLSGSGPFSPRVPVIYNQGHNDVTVINLGNLKGQARKRGAAIFYDGRSDGAHGLKGGRIIHAGMLGWLGRQASVNMIASLVDCEAVEIPLLIGDGYRIFMLEAEGCKNLDIGLVTAVPRPSGRPITLTGLNEGTRVRHLIAQQPVKSGVEVGNSPGTIVDRAELYGDPNKYIKIVHTHPYGNTNARFTQRPFLPASEGSFARKEQLVNRHVKEWGQEVEIIDFPGSLPNLHVKVVLDALFEDGGSDRIIDKTYNLELLSDSDYSQSGEYLFITTDGNIVRATGGQSGKVRFEDPDARKVIEWAMSHAPITILKEGLFTVPDMITVPRPNVSLVVNVDAELRQDPDILPPEMPGGRGGYRTLIYNPGHDNVEIVNLGVLRPYSGHRGVAIHFDGRTDRTKSRREFLETGLEGDINIDGGMVFATGPMYADDVVWLVDAKNMRVPLLLGRGYSNSPFALEGVEDSEIGIVAALMGAEAFENEAMDFNSFCQRIRIDLVIGTTPTEEVIDINNGHDCVFEEVRVYRTVGDVKPLRVSNWPDRQERSPRLMSQRPVGHDSKGTELREGIIVEKEVREWVQTVHVKPLAETLPRVELKTTLTAHFEDGEISEILNESFEWDL